MFEQYKGDDTFDYRAKCAKQNVRLLGVIPEAYLYMINPNKSYGVVFRMHSLMQIVKDV